MCKKLLRSDGQQRSYDKAKFPSNLNCGEKTVSETGPRNIGENGEKPQFSIFLTQRLEMYTDSIAVLIV